MIIGDPSYFPEKCVVTEKVVRLIAILSHPISPGGEASCQIILPQAQIQRENDIYVFCVSSSHCGTMQSMLQSLYNICHQTSAHLCLLCLVQPLRYDAIYASVT